MTFRRTRCAHCKGKFEPERPGQIVHADCAADYAIAKREREERDKAKELRALQRVERAADRKKRKELKRIPDLIREAQQAFNKWIRARDEKEPCISCGAPPPDLSRLHAGRDAGHYRSTGSASHLRFHEDNCHAQCVKCNQWGSGRAVDYRIGLVARLGLEPVEALESNNEPHKWTREELIAIKATYVQKLKELRSKEC